MLYFFHERQAVVVSHGCSKQQANVPEREIQVALRRKTNFESNPRVHASEMEKE